MMWSFVAITILPRIYVKNMTFSSIFVWRYKLGRALGNARSNKSKIKYYVSSSSNEKKKWELYFKHQPQILIFILVVAFTYTGTEK